MKECILNVNIRHHREASPPATVTAHGHTPQHQQQPLS